MTGAIKENLAIYDKPYKPSRGDLVTLAGGTCGTWEVREVEGASIKSVCLFSLGETSIGARDGEVVVKNGQEITSDNLRAEYLLRKHYC